MRIDASNLIAAQVTPVQRPKPPVHKAPEPATQAFEPIDFSKTAKDVSPEKSAQAAEEQKQPDQQPRAHHVHSTQTNSQQGSQLRQGSHLDITV